MKKLYLLILLISIILIGCTNKENVEEQIVGNDKDEHGCIGSAGYQYCPELDKCVRAWEEYCPSLAEQYKNESGKSQAINISTNYLIQKPLYKNNNGRLLEVEKVTFMRCSGCFSVYYSFLIDIENEIEKVEARVDINDWKATIADFTRGEPVIFTEDDCIYYNNGTILDKCINMTSIARVNEKWCCI